MHLRPTIHHHGPVCGRTGVVLNNSMFAKAAIWMVIALVLFTVFKQFEGRQRPGERILPYSEFLVEVKSGRIKMAEIRESGVTPEIIATTQEGERLRTVATVLDRGLMGDLINAGIKVEVKPREEQSLLTSIFVSWFPMLLLIGVWIFFMRQMQGGGRGGAFSFGKSRARMLDESNNNDHLRRRCRLRRGQGRSARTGRVPARPEQVPEARRPYSARRADGGIARHRQDAARQGDRRRSQGAVLLDLRLGLRRDVRRRRRGPRSRHVRKRQEARALHHLHR